MEETQKFNGLLLNNLAKIKRWTKFLSILSYIATALMIIGGISIVVFGVGSTGMAGFSAGGPLFALIYIASSALYYFSGKYLGDISQSAEMAGYTSETNHIEDLIGAMSKLFNFWGIIAVVVLVLYFLIIIGAVVLGFSGLS